MKKVILQSLILHNFKAQKDNTFEFSPEQSFVYGDNGTGKSTIFDAFTWLMFGKDSLGRTDGRGGFEVKTLDKNNNPIHKLEHSVEGKFLVDNKEVTLKRIYCEKWQKRKGSENTEMTGHETKFSWNDVDLLKGEYEKKVNDIVNESVFKLITSPLVFNSLPWKTSREIIVKLIGGEQDDMTLMSTDAKYQSLIEKLSNKTLIEYQKQIAASKSKLKEELKQYPIRIDQVIKDTPEPIDFDDIQKQIDAKDLEIKAIDEQLQDKSKASQAFYQEKSELTNKIGIISLKMGPAETKAKHAISDRYTQRTTEVNELEQAIIKLEKQVAEAEIEMKTLSETNTRLLSEQVELRKEFAEKDTEQLIFCEDEFKCPACNRLFESDDIESKKAELTANFNTNKANKLTDINRLGVAKGEQIKTNNENISEAKEKMEMIGGILSEKSEELKTLKNTPVGVETTQAILSRDEGYQALLAEIKPLEDKLSKMVLPEDNSDNELKMKKQTINFSLDSLKAKLLIRDQIARSAQTVIDLNNEEKVKAQALSDLEKDEFLIEEFTMLKIESIEPKVNALFTNVKFKLFNIQINGGIEETCEALIDGVPWSMANTASKIHSGIEIINKLSEYYEVSAPIFIDGRESVIRIPETLSQVINLVVQEGTKILKIA